MGNTQYNHNQYRRKRRRMGRIKERRRKRRKRRKRRRRSGRKGGGIGEFNYFLYSKLKLCCILFLLAEKKKNSAHQTFLNNVIPSCVL